VSEGCTSYVRANEGQHVKHGTRRKHVFSHVSANAYEGMEMENGSEIMRFIVNLDEKEKSKNMKSGK
jgi:hypothetical protein